MTRRVKLGKYIRFKSEHILRFFEGSKKTTIRLGIITPSRTRVYLESCGKILGEARVDSIKYTRVSQLTNEDARMDGFTSREELIRALKEIYPNICEDDWITIIRFSDVIRYSKPIEKESIKEARNMRQDIARIAKLALAYGVFSSSTERRVAAYLSTTGSIKKTSKMLGLTEEQIIAVIGSIIKRLKKLGILGTESD